MHYLFVVVVVLAVAAITLQYALFLLLVDLDQQYSESQLSGNPPSLYYRYAREISYLIICQTKQLLPFYQPLKANGFRLIITLNFHFVLSPYLFFNPPNYLAK